MELVFIEKLPSPTSPRVWRPFNQNEGFSSWWSKVVVGSSSSTYFEVHNNENEVARVELGCISDFGEYLDAPPSSEATLGIHFIEVHADYRRRGIASEVVRQLSGRYPDRRLLAFSEGADEFWNSLAWKRHEHPDGPAFYRPLYIQPFDWPASH